MSNTAIKLPTYETLSASALKGGLDAAAAHIEKDGAGMSAPKKGSEFASLSPKTLYTAFSMAAAVIQAKLEMKDMKVSAEQKVAAQPQKQTGRTR